METRSIKRNRKNLIFADRKKNESGYAMVVVLGIVILTIGILSSMTMLTINDTQNSLKNIGVLQSRIAGETALDTTYAALNIGNDTNVLTAISKFKYNGNSIFKTAPVTPDTSVPGVITNRYEWSIYYALTDDGNVAECLSTDLTQTCFKARLITKSFKAEIGVGSGPNAYSDQITREEYTIDIVVRKNCVSAYDGCTFSRLQQTITKRKYIEYVSISQTENLAPQVKTIADPSWNTTSSNPAFNSTLSGVNSYSNVDAISDGSIHTNGGTVKVCNGFNINSKWITFGSAGSQLTTFGIGGCDSVPTSIKKIKRNPVKLPDRIGDTTFDALKAISVGDSNSVYKYYFPSADTEVKFSTAGMQYKVSLGTISAVYPLPSNGVIFFDAPGGIVSGVVDGKITIASKAGTDIKIAGDLTYETPGSATGNDLIGVSSGKDIIIACGSLTAITRCNERRLDGFYKSNVATPPTSTAPGPLGEGGSIYTENWFQAKATNTPPALHLFGAMESYYRGTVGTTVSVPAGQVDTGYRKEYKFDKRLVEEQPPYMLRDGSVPFIRSGVMDVSCFEGTVNQCTN